MPVACERRLHPNGEGCVRLRILLIKSLCQFAETTTTTTSTVTSTAFPSTLADLAGPFIITDQTGQNAFAVDTAEQGAQDEDFLALRTLDEGTEFNLVAGALIDDPSVLQDGAGDTLYTDPESAHSFFNSDTVQGFLTPPTFTTGTALSCSVSQNPNDGTCPLTCTGGEGSQFYYCKSEAVEIELGSSEPPGTCSTAADYSKITLMSFSLRTRASIP